MIKKFMALLAVLSATVMAKAATLVASSAGTGCPIGSCPLCK
jgi:hypothetical protein